MNPNIPSPWRDRIVRSGYFVGALLFHLILFLMVATWIIFKAPVVPETTEFLPASIAQRPPPPKPPSQAGGDVRNLLEPDVHVTPPAVPTTAITSLNATAFTVKSVKVSMPSLPASFTSPTGTGLTGHGAPGQGAGAGSPFGSSEGTGTGQLVGYMYDLKQTADGKPTGMTPDQYRQILVQFMKSNWDESVLAPYYKSTKPLYTSEILIPDMQADAGPAAFHLEKEVQPSMWIVWYKGTVAPPTTGTFRFAGFCDDILLVRIDGDLVLDGSITPLNPKPGQKLNTPWPNHWIPNRVSSQNYGALREGDRVPLGTGQDVKIDIIIGEEPGGEFSASLFVLDVDGNYPAMSNGDVPLPLFQVGPGPATHPGDHPPIADTAEPWHSSDSK